MKRIAMLFVLFSLPAFGHNGVVRGAASDLKVAAKVAVYPVRHPKKTVKATFKAVKATVKAGSKV